MRAPKVILFLTTFLFLTLFIVWYIGQEQYIYFWDYAGYHHFYRQLGMQLTHRPFKAIGSVVNSVRKSDYNMLPTLFQMPFYFIFGSSRLAYILSIAVIFALPATVLFTTLMSELNGCDSDKKKSDDLILTFIAVAVIALAPQLWVPLLRGYVDVVGLNVIFIVLMLYFRKDWAEQTTQNLIALGFLLSLLILLRRWYAYWVVGFFFATAVNALISALLERNPIEKLRLSCKSVFIVGAAAVLSFFAVATPIAVKMLTSNYRDLYSAYRSSDSVFSHLVSLSQHFGLPLIVASVTGLLIMLAKDGKRRIALFIAVQFTTTFILFTRTQDIGVHHYYWVSATIFILTAFFLQQTYSWLTTRPLKAAFLCALTGVCLSTFLGVFHKDMGKFFSPASAVFPQLKYYPLRRNDLDQVQSLLHALNDLTRDSDGKIYVLTSSMALNGSIVLTGCRDFEPSLADLEQKVLPTYDVDKRDGFPLQFFKARYVVVTNPVGYHLAPENQRVIGLLAEELIKGERLGRSYERLPFEFVLEDDSRVYIYKRYKNFKAEDLKYISDTFVELYPDYRERFEIRLETIQELSGF